VNAEQNLLDLENTAEDGRSRFRSPSASHRSQPCKVAAEARAMLSWLPPSLGSDDVIVRRGHLRERTDRLVTFYSAFGLNPDEAGIMQS
jgi:hypothetical protein